MYGYAYLKIFFDFSLSSFDLNKRGILLFSQSISKHLSNSS